jgi:hypothetical protein
MIIFHAVRLECRLVKFCYGQRVAIGVTNSL